MDWQPRAKALRFCGFDVGEQPHLLCGPNQHQHVLPSPSPPFSLACLLAHSSLFLFPLLFSVTLCVSVLILTVSPYVAFYSIPSTHTRTHTLSLFYTGVAVEYFNLSNQAIGITFSAFFYGYILTQV